MAVAPSENLWVALSTGQHLTACRTRGVGRVLHVGGGISQELSLQGWAGHLAAVSSHQKKPHRSCLPPQQSKAMDTLSIQTRPLPDTALPLPPPLHPWGSAWHQLPRMTLLEKNPGTKCT